MSEEYNSRETSKRAFAEEFNNATHQFRESDDERAPKYTLLPTGEKANRVLIVGTMTEKTDVGSDSEYWRARVVDPTGTFFVYAGQYEPEAASTISSTDTPSFVAAVGKPDQYEQEDNVMLSIQAESFTVITEDEREQWIAETAEKTLERIRNGDSEYAMKAKEVYEGDPEDYVDTVIEALESLSGE